MHSKKSDSKKLIIIIAALVLVVALIVIIFVSCGSSDGYPADMAYSTIHFENETDALGRIIKSNHYGTDDKLKSYEVYEYDENNNKIKSVQYDSNDEIIIQYKYEYNKDGFKTKQTTLDKNGVITQSVVYEFVDGVQTGQYNYVGAKETLQTYVKYEYDKQGRCIKETSYYDDGEIKNYTEHKYDAKGECTSQRFDADGKPIK